MVLMPGGVRLLTCSFLQHLRLRPWRGGGDSAKTLADRSLDRLSPDGLVLRWASAAHCGGRARARAVHNGATASRAQP